jgi:hypothetical protein
VEVAGNCEDREVGRIFIERCSGAHHEKRNKNGGRGKEENSSQRRHLLPAYGYQPMYHSSCKIGSAVLSLRH